MSIVVLLTVMSFTSTEAQDAELTKAAKVKAAFLYNFIKFVQWPSERSPASTQQATICIVGNHPFGTALSTLKTQLSGKMDVSIVMDAGQTSLSQCHVLFIGNGVADAMGDMLAAARKNNILTVSENKDFADKGGIIEMKTVEKSIGLFFSNKVNLRINMKAAETASLKINPQLLEIAAEVIK